AVGADRVAARDPRRLDDRQGGPERAAGRDDDDVLVRGPLQGAVHRGRHRAVVVDERAVDVEPDQQPLPGEGAQVLLEAGAGRLTGGGVGGGAALQRAIGSRGTGGTPGTTSATRTARR